MIPIQIVKSITAWKTLSGNPLWVDDEVVKFARVPMNVQGVGLEGLFVRIKIPNTVDAFGTMVQIEWDGHSSTVPLARIDWKAMHTNPNRGPVELRLDDFKSTHEHAFELNFLPKTNRMLQKNLPIAREVAPDPGTIEALFATAEEILMIEGLSKIGRPSFQANLF